MTVWFVLLLGLAVLMILAPPSLSKVERKLDDIHAELVKLNKKP